MRPGLPPVLEVLAAAASVAGAGVGERLVAASARVADWDEVVREAEGHGVLPLLDRALRADPDAPVPPEVRERIGALAAGTSLSSLEMAGVLVTVLGTLDGAGVPALTYKGPTLAEGVYGEVGLRRFVDVDILVHPADAVRARRALEDVGYRPLKPTPSGRDRALVRRTDEVELVRPGAEGSVDLQWAIEASSSAIDLRVADLFGASRTVPLGGLQIRTLGLEDLLLVLCVHGCKHHWFRLLWVADVAHLLVASPAPDAERVLRRAGSLGLGRMVRLGLALARDLLDAPLPPGVERAIGRDPAVGALEEQVVRRRLSRLLGDDPEDSELTFDPLTLRMRERPSDRARYVLRNVFTPTVQDWEAVPLPRWMDWAYPVIRPVRLAGRYGGAAIRARSGGREANPRSGG